jgi:hypothetical protein
MSVLNKIVFFQNRRDEVPNQELAKELVKTENRLGISEIVQNLQYKNKSVQSDCLKVLYEISYIQPEFIADYVLEFLELLKSKTNRVIWGGMIVLATIAENKPKEIFEQLTTVTDVIEHGSLITVVWGVKALAKVAATNQTYKQKISPFLIGQLKKCIPRDVAMHAENILPAIDQTNKTDFLSILETRKPQLSSVQLARLKKITKNF